MIGSPEINKVIRKILSPILKENGFNKVNTRHNWCWVDHSIWVLDITAVGKYFSDISGWPPMSVHVGLEIYYNFIPSEDDEVKKGNNGELLPKYYQCHLIENLNCNLDQTSFTNQLYNPAERDRNDIWWIQPDGSNVEDVICDISKSFMSDGLKWFKENTDLKLLLPRLKARVTVIINFTKQNILRDFLEIS